MSMSKGMIIAADIVRRARKEAPQLGEDESGVLLFDFTSSNAVEGAFVRFFLEVSDQFNGSEFRAACRR